MDIAGTDSRFYVRSIPSVHGAHSLPEGPFCASRWLLRQPHALKLTNAFQFEVAVASPGGTYRYTIAIYDRERIERGILCVYGYVRLPGVSSIYIHLWSVAHTIVLTSAAP